MLANIFTLALAVIVSAFVELGIYTFVKAPDDDPSNYFVDHTTATDEELLERERRHELHRNATRRFNGVVSILSLVISTGLLAISLLLGSRFAVLCNGILLGGVFSLIFGVGVGIYSGGKSFRFIIATLSLIVALTLGYIKFVPHS